jgi:hypothetical protein
MSDIILDIAASFSARNGASAEFTRLCSVSSAIARDEGICALARETIATADVAAKEIARFRTKDRERKFILPPHQNKRVQDANTKWSALFRNRSIYRISCFHSCHMQDNGRQVAKLK